MNTTVNRKTKIEGLENIKYITTNSAMHYAMDNAGNLYGWGDNSHDSIAVNGMNGNQYEFKKVKNNAISLYVGKSIIHMNNISLPIPAPPIIVDGRTMLPIREVAEALGGTVQWDNDTVTVGMDGNRLKLEIGNKQADFNGVYEEMEVVPQLINEKTYLPLRYICEKSGAEVFWEELQGKITITN